MHQTGTEREERLGEFILQSSRLLDVAEVRWGEVTPQHLYWRHGAGWWSGHITSVLSSLISECFNWPSLRGSLQSL